MTLRIDDWLSVDAYIGPPGSGRRRGKFGLHVRAVLDPSSDITLVPEALLKRIDTDGSLSTPMDFLRAEMPGGQTLIIGLVLLDLAIVAAGGQRFTAQITAGVLEGSTPTQRVTIGTDVLSTLGLQVSIDYDKHSVRVEKYSWEDFESDVASCFRTLGAQVKANVNLSGFQIDVVLAETTNSGQSVTTVVECKYFKDRVGNREVNDFARVVATLKNARLADKGVIVSHRGFTPDAALVASGAGIELLTLADLQQRITERQSVVGRTGKEAKRGRGRKSRQKKVPDTKGKEAIISDDIRKRIFVVMPFTPDVQDVYYLGIRDTVAALNGACERADEIQHTGGILEKIYDSIRTADVVIAELTAPNPNVYYEVGYAHALGKKVVLLTRDVATAPFDLRGYNHVVYKSIVDLRAKLSGIMGELLR